MGLFAVLSLAYTAFIAVVGGFAIRDTARSFGPPQAFGLALGLAAIYFWLPLGGLLTVGASVGALTMARHQNKQLGLRA